MCDGGKQPQDCSHLDSLLDKKKGKKKRKKEKEPASLPQDKCIYICNQKHNAYQDMVSSALDISSLTILVF